MFILNVSIHVYVILFSSLPLVQSRKNFASMDLQLRKEFQSTLEKFSEKYGLCDITFPSFTLSFGYRNKYCASDIVYGLLAILENSVRTRNCSLKLI